jgi:hypothetical protein
MTLGRIYILPRECTLVNTIAVCLQTLCSYPWVGWCRILYKLSHICHDVTFAKCSSGTGWNVEVQEDGCEGQSSESKKQIFSLHESQSSYRFQLFLHNEFL